MRLALLSIWLALPLCAQVRATLEPLADIEVKRALGKDALSYSLWTVTVESPRPTVQRGEITRLTPFTELPAGMSADLLTKSEGMSFWTLMGKGWDSGAPLAGPGLLSWGISASSPWSMGVGAGITLGGIIRNALKGQAPDKTQYLAKLLPDTVACQDGYCGEWLVMTSRQEMAAKITVGDALGVANSVHSGLQSALGVQLEPVVATATHTTAPMTVNTGLPSHESRVLGQFLAVPPSSDDPYALGSGAFVSSSALSSVHENIVPKRTHPQVLERLPVNEMGDLSGYNVALLEKYQDAVWHSIGASQ
jgi:hypothetical protein